MYYIDIILTDACMEIHSYPTAIVFDQAHALIIYLHYSGLPVPIVAIAAGIANKHYGSERGLVY